MVYVSASLQTIVTISIPQSGKLEAKPPLPPTLPLRGERPPATVR